MHVFETSKQKYLDGLDYIVNLSLKLNLAKRYRRTSAKANDENYCSIRHQFNTGIAVLFLEQYFEQAH